MLRKVLQMWASPRAGGAVVVGCDSSWESQNAVVAATREESRCGCELVQLAAVETQHFWPDDLARLSRVGPADQRLTSEASGDAYLTKPFSPTKLVAAVQSVLGAERGT